MGGIDWGLRNFHGYLTHRGTTYNAYLIVDEKTVLVDTVKHYLYDEMMERVKSVIDPAKIDCLVSNHVEMDHSGSIKAIDKMIPGIEIITSVNGEKGLGRHYGKMNFRVVQSSETINIGRRNLEFFHMPMVHWPDSMATYLPDEKILMPNDAFGQHIASNERFDDQLDMGILREEAVKYYSNIVLPYGEQVKKAIALLSGLDIDIICPSHGIIWRSNIPEILKVYMKLADNQTDNKAVIVYDTMWDSTGKLAYKLQDGLLEEGIKVEMKDLKNNHISDVVACIAEAKLIIIGSPTLNNGIMPSVGAFLTYIKGLKPKNRIGFSFGSYGWGGQSVRDIEETMKQMGWVVPVEGKKVSYVPDENDLCEFKNTGKELAKILKNQNAS